MTPKGFTKMSRDTIPGGLADKMSPEDFDPEQLKKGIKAEMEHTSSREIATEIAMDHLVEDPKYYDKLEKMEQSNQNLKLQNFHKIHPVDYEGGRDSNTSTPVLSLPSTFIPAPGGYQGRVAHIKGFCRFAGPKERKEYVLNKYFQNYDPQEAQQIVEQLFNADPSNNKQYLDWIAKQYLQNPNLELEDVPLTLQNFEKLKRKPKFQGLKDINQYRSLDELAQVVYENKELLQSGREYQRQQTQEGQKLILSQPPYQVIEIWTAEAASKLCRNTEWCVKDPKWFAQYTPPLYMVTKNGAPYALVDVASEQWMNVYDEELEGEHWAEVAKLMLQIRPEIKEDPTFAYNYAVDIIKGRWPEGEEAIKKNPNIAYWYAKNFVKGRWPEGEEVIKKGPYAAYEYAKNIIKGRWPEGEEVIKKNPLIAYEYARDIIKGRWPEGEEALKKSPYHAYEYARDVIKGRWPEVEEALKKSPLIWKEYRDFISQQQQQLVKAFTSNIPAPGGYQGTIARKIRVQVAPTKAMKDLFEKRTKEHIDRVKKYLKKLEEHYPDYDFEDEEHDASKYKEPEYEPYLFITWKHKNKNEGKDYEIPEEWQEKCDKATFHHTKVNKHHPECWDDDQKEDSPRDRTVDATAMPKQHILEMVADWCAMSEELGNSPKDWADDNIGKRWKFSSDQEELIYKAIDLIWDKKTTEAKKKKKKKPGGSPGIQTLFPNGIPTGYMQSSPGTPAGGFGGGGALGSIKSFTKRAKQKLTIGIDVDGVLADFNALLRDIASQYIPIEDKDKETYKIKDLTHADRDLESKVMTEVYEKHRIPDAPVIEGAVEKVNELYDKGHTIIILTARQEDWKPQTEEWLDKHGFKYHKLIHNNNKGSCAEEEGIDIMIDDKPDNIEDLREHGIGTIIFDQPWNREADTTRMKAWRDINASARFRKFASFQEEDVVKLRHDPSQGKFRITGRHQERRGLTYWQAEKTLPEGRTEVLPDGQMLYFDPPEKQQGGRSRYIPEDQLVKAQVKGLTKFAAPRWTTEDKNTLKKLYLKYRDRGVPHHVIYKAAAELLGKSFLAVKQKLESMYDIDDDLKNYKFEHWDKDKIDRTIQELYCGGKPINRLSLPATLMYQITNHSLPKAETRGFPVYYDSFDHAIANNLLAVGFERDGDKLTEKAFSTLEDALQYYRRQEKLAHMWSQDEILTLFKDAHAAGLPLTHSFFKSHPDIYKPLMGVGRSLEGLRDSIGRHGLNWADLVVEAAPEYEEFYADNGRLRDSTEELRIRRFLELNDVPFRRATIADKIAVNDPSLQEMGYKNFVPDFFILDPEGNDCAIVEVFGSVADSGAANISDIYREKRSAKEQFYNTLPVKFIAINNNADGIELSDELLQDKFADFLRG